MSSSPFELTFLSWRAESQTTKIQKINLNFFSHPLWYEIEGGYQICQNGWFSQKVKFLRLGASNYQEIGLEYKVCVVVCE